MVLEHVVLPLLLSLARGPEPAMALVSIGRTLGGSLTAKHLLMPLLAVLASSGSVRQSWTGVFWMSTLNITAKLLVNHVTSSAPGPTARHAEKEVNFKSAGRARSQFSYCPSCR